MKYSVSLMYGRHYDWEEVRDLLMDTDCRVGGWKESMDLSLIREACSEEQAIEHAEQEARRLLAEVGYDVRKLVREKAIVHPWKPRPQGRSMCSQCKNPSVHCGCNHPQIYYDPSQEPDSVRMRREVQRASRIVAKSAWLRSASDSRPKAPAGWNFCSECQWHTRAGLGEEARISFRRACRHCNDDGLVPSFATQKAAALERRKRARHAAESGDHEHNPRFLRERLIELETETSRVAAQLRATQKPVYPEIEETSANPDMVSS